MKEQVINVPLMPDVKAALKKQADRNGRATIREAAKIITKSVMKGSQK